MKYIIDRGKEMNEKTGPDTDREYAMESSSKLTADQVFAIRDAYSAGFLTCNELGRLFGVGFAAIHDIVTRKTWTHLNEDYCSFYPKEVKK